MKCKFSDDVEFIYCCDFDGKLNCFDIIDFK